MQSEIPMVSTCCNPSAFQSSSIVLAWLVLKNLPPLVPLVLNSRVLMVHLYAMALSIGKLLVLSSIALLHVLTLHSQ